MALDDADRRGGGCERCGGSGIASEWQSEAEARQTLGDLWEQIAGQGEFRSAHFSIPCPNCDAGERARLELDRPVAAAPNPSGFDEALRLRCAARCAFYGDPPCWRLPELVEPCEQITPCEECLEDRPNPDKEEISDG